MPVYKPKPSQVRIVPKQDGEKRAAGVGVVGGGVAAGARCRPR
jgi:hypothetical protein